MTQDEFNKIVGRIWPILTARAATGSSMTYKELGARVGIYWRHLNRYLGAIQAYCERKRLPSLQVLVVNARTRVPGSGYTGSPRDAPAVARATARVARFNWSRVSNPFRP